MTLMAKLDDKLSALENIEKSFVFSGLASFCIEIHMVQITHYFIEGIPQGVHPCVTAIDTPSLYIRSGNRSHHSLAYGWYISSFTVADITDNRSVALSRIGSKYV